MSDNFLTTSMTFGGVVIPAICLPKTLPIPSPEAKSVEHFMRAGDDGPGIRVLQMLGSHPSYDNVDFTLYKLTSSMVTSLEVLFRAQAPFLWVLDFGDSTSRTYKVTFQDRGLVLSLPSTTGYSANAFKADISLRIMENLG